MSYLSMQCIKEMISFQRDSKFYSTRYRCHCRPEAGHLGRMMMTRDLPSPIRQRYCSLWIDHHSCYFSYFTPIKGGVGNGAIQRMFWRRRCFTDLYSVYPSQERDICFTAIPTSLCKKNTKISHSAQLVGTDRMEWLNDTLGLSPRLLAPSYCIPCLNGLL